MFCSVSRIHFKIPFGYNRLQGSWSCVVVEKDSRHTSVRLRSLSTSRFAHKLFARSLEAYYTPCCPRGLLYRFKASSEIDSK